MSHHPREQRWRGRPVMSACLRFFVFAAPIAASITTAWAIAPHLHARRWYQLVGNVIAVMAVSTLALVITDRLARRLLPLAVLLRLSLAFPDEAPSRIALARRAASTRDLEARVETARRDGVDDEPTRAAEQILSLVAAVEAHDRATRGHSERVRIYADLTADELRLTGEDRDRLRWAALLHDVGKLRVPAKVLNKPAKLTEREWGIVQKHPDEGARLTSPLRAWLGPWASAIEQHHERFDGSGYPRGLEGAGISLGGRIVAVADCYETMTASRPYMRARTAAKARAELVECSGTHFDPTIVRAFLRVSVRRLAWASGPLSWIVQMPFFRGLEAVAGVAGEAARNAATAGALTFAMTPGLGSGAPAVAAPAASSPRPATSASATAAPRTSPPRVVTVSQTVAPSPSPTATARPKESPTPDPHPRPTPPADPGRDPDPHDPGNAEPPGTTISAGDPLRGKKSPLKD